MKPEYINQLVMPKEMPALAVWAVAALGIAAWVGVHQLKRPPGRRGGLLHFILRTLVGFGALVTCADALQRILVFATTWPLLPILFAGATGVEIVLIFYSLERSTTPPRAAHTLPALRVALVIGLTLMLCQPVRVYESSRRIERKVAVLVDDSASMRIEDSGMTPSEKIRLAESLSVKEAERTHRLDNTARSLDQLQQSLAAHTDWLLSLGSTDLKLRAEQLDKKARDIRESVRETGKNITEQTNTITAALADAKILKPDAPARAMANEVIARIASDVQPRLNEVIQVIDTMYSRDKDKPKPTDGYERILDGVRRSALALKENTPKLRQVGDSIDDAFYATLSADAKRKIDDSVLRKRCDLARDLLLHHKVTNYEKGTTDPNLIEKLSDKYGVKLYTFNTEAHSTDEKGLASSYASATNSLYDSGPAQRTDIATAIEKATRDIPSEQLAGILLMTDGRHNTPAQVEPLARTLGLKSIPVSSVLFGGGSHPPTDAGILAVEAPDTVYTNDCVYISADLKFDGLKGTNVTVSLFWGSNIVSTASVAVATESLRQRIQLSHEPRTNGLQIYRLELQSFTNEVTLSNNTVTIPVTVMDDRTRLLIIEDRPRWEFRYLKNLFSGRDSSVAIQHVLFHPDSVAGVPDQPKVAASASRPPADIEANTLPASDDEWMKFDVVILGDIEPAELGEAALKSIRRFVADRGGTLVVIAGSRHMPHNYATSPLAELLPVTVEPDDRPMLPPPEGSFRIRLTPEGRESPVMRLAVNPVENEKAWADIPDLYWRHPVKSVKPGATVLAFAAPTSGQDSILGRTANEVPDEATLLRREQFHNANPLIVAHHMAHGRVVFMAFDETWRLRYRIGDTYHHRLWGQLLRWGTGERLAAGNNYVRLGTDHARYNTDEAVKVKARILQHGYTPVNDASVAVIIYTGDRRIMRKSLQFVADSAGNYEADIGRLPVGTYRAELDCREAARILRDDGIDSLSCGFTVGSNFPVELNELSGDRGFLSRLASLTDGKVVEPDRLYDLGTNFGTPSVTLKERRQHDLWNAWWFLLILMTLAGAEWFIRKKVSLP